jgi:hypothetical protein
MNHNYIFFITYYMNLLQLISFFIKILLMFVYLITILFVNLDIHHQLIYNDVILINMVELSQYLNDGYLLIRRTQSFMMLINC